MKHGLSNSTANALLGLLSIKPMSGYDLRHFIPESIGHFWSESYGQIYPTLRKMAEEGLVVKRTETQQGKPDRHIYSLSGAGHERLQHWLELPFADEVPRNELLLKMFFGAHASAAVNREHILTYLEKQERDLKTFTNTAAFLRNQHSETRNSPSGSSPSTGDATTPPLASHGPAKLSKSSKDSSAPPAETKPQRTQTPSGGTPWRMTRSG